MLLNDFFIINNLEISVSEINAELEIICNHKIFEGHFPGHAVVPGVCMMQIIKEILENSLQIKTNLINANEMKFLSIVAPEKNNKINATIKYSRNENDTIQVVAMLFKNELIHFKFKGQFSSVSKESHQ